jgi:hypothetical protein
MHDGAHDQLAISIFAAVSPDEWCGEFEQRFDALLKDDAVADVET